jgi:hypothetical protein
MAARMPKLAQVNTDDIGDAIRLGCRAMCSVFNADDNDIPFFGSRVWPQPELSFSSYHSEAHVPGRHLNALLSAQAALGLPLDEACIDKHARAAFFSFSGPLALPLNRETLGGPLHVFMPHNIREGLHALYALIRFRQSEQAERLLAASLAAIDQYWRPGAEGGWSRAELEGTLGLRLVEIEAPFVSGLARAIGPLVKIYRATGYGPALGLALRLKDQALSDHFLASGDYERARLGAHVHSVTCVMSSLAQLADVTADAPLLARVKAFYDNGLNALRDGVGWSLESSRPEANPDFGEVNNTGDIVETALILGRWGYVEYYGDAERILRSHLLPSQLRDISFIPTPDNPSGADGQRDVAARHRGAFGFPAPYGHRPLGVEQIGFNMDIVGGAVGSLCAAYEEISRRTPAGHVLNLLFDHETPALAVQSPYTHGRLQITLKEPAPLFVRLPQGVALGDITLAGVDRPAWLTNGYLFIENPPVHAPLTIAFPLPERELVLRHRTRDIRVRLRGDQAVAMDNFGADWTFFDPLD